MATNTISVAMKGDATDLNQKLANMADQLDKFKNKADKSSKGLDLGKLMSTGFAAATQLLSHSFASAFTNIGAMAAQVSTRIAGLFGKVGDKIGAMLGSALPLVGSLVGGIFDKAFDAVISGAQVGKLAERFGISTQEMAGLELAFVKIGLDSDDAAKSIKKMQHYILEAAEAGGEGAATLKHFGIEAKELVKKNAIDQLQTMSDVLGKFGNRAQASGVAGNIFGEREGAKMLDLQAKGPKFLQDQINEAKKLGLSLTAGEAAEARKLKDAWREVSLATDGLFRTIGIQLAPLLTMIANTFRDWIVSLKQTIGQVALLVKGFKSFPEFMKYVFVGLDYEFEKIMNKMIYFFTTILPAKIAAGLKPWAAADNKGFGELMEKRIVPDAEKRMGDKFAWMTAQAKAQGAKLKDKVDKMVLDGKPPAIGGDLIKIVDNTKAPAAMLQGTAEAMSVIAKANRDGGTMPNILRDILKVAKEELDRQNRMIEIMKNKGQLWNAAM